MNTRQEELFQHIVKEYIGSAEPVGSNFLLSKYNLNVSSATVRNDMALLEREGLIYQPYTSAGRMPTEEGYRLWLGKYIKDTGKIAKRDENEIDNVLSSIKDNHDNVREKALAKKIAELSHTTVIVAFSKDNVYYTGVSNLLSQPEFADMKMVYSISQVVDRMDEVVGQIFHDIDDVDVKLGEENHFSDRCASVFVKTNRKLFGILGPIRMNYERNLGMINYVKKLI